MDTRSNGSKQRKLAQQKATEVMLQLLQEAKAAAIPARHVLFDTWFCSPASLLKIHGLGYDVVAMAKKTEKIHYLHQGCLQDVKAIYKQHRKRRGRSKYLLRVEAAVVNLAKLGKDENVTISVLAKICGVLNCDVSDIMEMIPDETTESEDKVNG